jgi:hypothetical protein
LGFFEPKSGEKKGVFDGLEFVINKHTLLDCFSASFLRKISVASINSMYSNKAYKLLLKRENLKFSLFYILQIDTLLSSWVQDTSMLEN